MKNIIYRSLIFLSVLTFLMAGYSANSADMHSNKASKTENSGSNGDETVVKSISFEATPVFSQASLHRFSIVLFSFEFGFESVMPHALLFPQFINIFKHVLFSRISPTNAP